ncbi:MAG: DUF3667 domain-containing protein [Acidobacteriota bacterium]
MPNPVALGDVCPNCGAEVSGNYCSECGQALRDPRRPGGAMLLEMAREALSLDGKLLRTLRALLVPGLLSLFFVEGKRASYVTPVRLYLVTSLLFFLLVGIPAPDVSRANVYIGDDLIGREVPLESATGRMQLFEIDESSFLYRFFPSFEERLNALKTLPVQQLVDRYFAGLERTIPTALIVFVPFLALALKLLYVRRGVLYVDHLVFALHAQSFLFLLLAACRVLNALGMSQLLPGVLTYLAAFLLLFPTYVFLGLRRFYEQPWWKCLLKSAALAFLYLLLVQPVVVAAIFYTVMTL